MSQMLLIIINIITLFQIIFFTAFLFFKRRNRLSNKLLIGFLISQGLIYINNLGFLFYDFFYKNLPHLFYIGEPFIFLWAPFLYLYIRSLTNSDFKMSRKQLPHFLPFFTAFVFLFITVYIHRAETKRLILRTHDIGLFSDIWNSVCHIQIMVYVIVSIIHLNRFAVRLKNNYSSIEKINLSWLRVILYCYIVAWVIALSHLVRRWILVETPEIFTITVYLFFLAFFNIIVFKALTTPEIFFSQNIPVAEKKKSLSENKRKQYLEKVEKYVIDNKAYLSPTISLSELAEMVEIPPRSLSEVLNQSLNQSFFDFINKYRIDEAEKLLLSTDDDSITVSEVIWDVGFNSKSAFYNAFKKHKGYSPARLKQIRNTGF